MRSLLTEFNKEEFEQREEEKYNLNKENKRNTI